MWTENFCTKWKIMKKVWNIVNILLFTLKFSFSFIFKTSSLAMYFSRSYCSRSFSRLQRCPRKFLTFPCFFLPSLVFCFVQVLRVVSSRPRQRRHNKIQRSCGCPHQRKAASMSHKNALTADAHSRATIRSNDISKISTSSPTRCTYVSSAIDDIVRKTHLRRIKVFNIEDRVGCWNVF